MRHWTKKHRVFTVCALGGIVVGAVLFVMLYRTANDLFTRHEMNRSVIVSDRNGAVIRVKPNTKGYYATYTDGVPEVFAGYLLQKEDKYFYIHPGINPVSIGRAVIARLRGQKPTSSTITQQLAKILLNHEQERSLKNKLQESAGAIALEVFFSKKEILSMYLNSIYFGNQRQGIAEASRYYFDSSPDTLNDRQILSLLATLSSPSKDHPLSPTNERAVDRLAARLGVTPDVDGEAAHDAPDESEPENQTAFELAPIIDGCDVSCSTTIDTELTEKIRALVKRRIEALAPKNVKNAAVVVIKFPENELLSIVGSPNPASNLESSRINMAVEPRPIGSTVKPFIYLKGFEKGLRPYTLVLDREYKYTIGDGFPLYPKNYDYEYRGEVTLATSLANSLNVPAVKVLEYVGIDEFSRFLTHDLEFQPIQPIESYQLGIALGGLEMDLLQLSRYFTLFAQQGALLPLRISSSTPALNELLPNHAGAGETRDIADDRYIQLVNAILTDRLAAADEFGLVSNLNLFQKNYALKTGTSREYHDSWIVGYTPDFLVGVWVGNAENTAMDGVSGQLGAGMIWSDVMQLLLNSEYNKKTPFPKDALEPIGIDGTEYLTFPGENPKDYRRLMPDTELILSPHAFDVFLLEDRTEIPLRASESITWYVNGREAGNGNEINFAPTAPGTYRIRAESKESDAIEEIEIYVREKEE